MLTPKNWASFQHYKDRNPPWIKLHKSLLDDCDFQSLPLASRALAPMLWLLASEQQDGTIKLSNAQLSFRLRMPLKELEEFLKPLIQYGFFVEDGQMLAERLHGAVPETETETEKRERQNPSPKTPSWAKKHDPEVVDIVQRVMAFWPGSSERQPNGESVPKTHGPILADRLTAIKGEGGSMAICQAIAERFVEEYRSGGWLKAAENFFGIGTKDKPAPWKSYYKAHLTNQEVDLAS